MQEEDRDLEPHENACSEQVSRCQCRKGKKSRSAGGVASIRVGLGVCEF